MTIREFLELASTNEEVYLYNLLNDSETSIEVDDMNSLGEEILESEICSWDYHNHKLCINYDLT